MPLRSPAERAAYIKGSLATVDSLIAGISVLPEVIDKNHLINMLHQLQVIIQVEGVEVDPSP